MLKSIVVRIYVGLENSDRVSQGGVCLEEVEVGAKDV